MFNSQAMRRHLIICPSDLKLEIFANNTLLIVKKFFRTTVVIGKCNCNKSGKNNTEYRI